MNPQLLKEAKNLAQRATNGHVANALELHRLAEDLSGQFPQWLIELLATVPLCGLEIGWQAEEPTDDDDGLAWMEILSPEAMRAENLKAYPGKVIAPMGYICIAGDSSGAGDPYFIDTRQSDDPPVYQIYHDVSDQPDEILSQARILVSESLSKLFKTAQL